MFKPMFYKLEASVYLARAANTHVMNRTPAAALDPMRALHPLHRSVTLMNIDFGC